MHQTQTVSAIKKLLAVRKRELNANRRTSFIVFIIKPVNKKLVFISHYRTTGLNHLVN